MKYFNLLIAISFFMFSCGKDSETLDVITDFSGTYQGEINCSGTLESENGNIFSITISSSQDGENYVVDFGEGVVFNATSTNNTLEIERQTLNASGGFDVITLSGILKKFEGDSNYSFEFEHTVDDEGLSNCQTTLKKV